MFTSQMCVCLYLCVCLCVCEGMYECLYVYMYVFSLSAYIYLAIGYFTFIPFFCLDIKAYYCHSLPYVTKQTRRFQDTAPSVMEMNATEVAAHQESENEWNHSGLASRLSQKVDYITYNSVYLLSKIHFITMC